MYLEQSGSGTGVDSLDDRDKESVVADHFSSVVARPTDMLSQISLMLFNQVSFTYSGMGSLAGYEYLRAKDSCSWLGLKPKEFIPVISTMVSAYIKGTNNRPKK